MKKFAFLPIIAILYINAFSQQYRPVNADDYYQENFIRNSDFVYKDNIKTALLYRQGYELSAPVVQLNSGEQLIFSFDDLDADNKKYEYTIIHCDADWNVSDLMPNEYLESFTDDYIENYQYSVNTMQSYTYYEKVIPNDVIRFTISGNYLLKVYTEGDPGDVIFTRRFFVYDPKVDVDANVQVPSDIDERLTKQEVVFTIHSEGYSITDPYRELHVTIRQNGRWDNEISDLKPRSVSGTDLLYDYDGVNVFDGGSDFRYFDLKSLRYNSFRVQSVEYAPETGYQVYLHPDKVKNKNVFENIQESINGRFLIKTEDMSQSNNEADYAMVHFFLPYKTPLIDGKLYLFGGLTYWQYLRDAKLSYDYEKSGFSAELFLKQGFYNYQFVLLPNNSKVGDVTLIEGNFFDTNNEYTIYVYHRPMGSRYDRLINITSIMAHPN
jgi:hypothetical protein